MNRLRRWNDLKTNIDLFSIKYQKEVLAYIWAVMRDLFTP